jgi:site-specific recombinase
MSIFRYLISLHKILTYRKDLNRKIQLDTLFSSLNATKKMSLEASALWIVKLGIWLRDNDDSANSWSVRSRFLFQLLERNPEWYKSFQIVLDNVFSNLKILDLLCESGLPLEHGLWSELWERIFEYFLPNRPLIQDSGLLLIQLFPAGTDFEALNKADLDPWIKLLAQSMRHLQVDIEEALIFLASQIRATSLHPSIRKRMHPGKLRDLSWFLLAAECENFLASRNPRVLLSILNDCKADIEQLYFKLQESGVNTDLVFRMEKLNLFLSRVSLLIPVLTVTSETSIKDLWLHLIEMNQNKRGIYSLYLESSRLLAQKIVEKNSETGDHYIARNKGERIELFKHACGGGFLTAFTVYFKLWFMTFNLAPFQSGFLISLNYAVSFVIIQFLGWTLATKQPANTATTIALKLKDLQRPEKLKGIVDEIRYLCRSQILAVFGNLLLVVPVALALTYLYNFVTGEHILTVEQAHHNYESVVPGIGTFVFAAWTGVLLWISSLVAGWIDNWFTFKEVAIRLKQNTTLIKALSPEAASRAGNLVKFQLPGLFGNICLGFLLGLSPGFFKFFGIPIEIRHITLSAGSLAASIPVLGTEFIFSWQLLSAILGILGIGILNVGFSFSIAFAIAMKAKNISASQKRRILRELFGIGKSTNNSESFKLT